MPQQRKSFKKAFCYSEAFEISRMLDTPTEALAQRLGDSETIDGIITSETNDGIITSETNDGITTSDNETGDPEITARPEGGPTVAIREGLSVW